MLNTREGSAIHRVAYAHQRGLSGDSSHLSTLNCPSSKMFSHADLYKFSDITHNDYSQYTAEELYNLGLSCSDEEWSSDIRQSLINTQYCEFIYNAGKDWNDERYDESIKDALVTFSSISNNAKWLFYAGVNWDSDRFCDSITNALIGVSSNTDDGTLLYLAGLEWEDDRYNDSILDALVSIGDAASLYQAGTEWVDERYDDDILTALLATGHPDYIHDAEMEWPIDRLSNTFKDEIISFGDYVSLYYAGFWDDSNYRDDLADAFLASLDYVDNHKRIEMLYNAGMHWTDEMFSSKIGEELTKFGDSKTIRLANMYWPRNRQYSLRHSGDWIYGNSYLDENLPTSN